MKILQIAWKDTLTRLRDWKALIGILAAPLIIAGLIGLAFGNIGGLGGSTPPISDIEVIVVNLDEGILGEIYVEVLTSEDLDDLLNVRHMDDLPAARHEIEAGNARAVVSIPAGFSEALISASLEDEPASAIVEVYTDPAANVSPFIVQRIVEQITAGVNTVLFSGRISVDQILTHSEILGPNLADLGQIINQEIQPENFDFQDKNLSLEITEIGEANEGIEPFAFFVPGMAVFFLMFSLFDGSRSILLEEGRGTLHRLMTTPTAISQIILGKMGGTFLTGLLQFAVLVIASTYIFGISWGSSISGLVTIVALTVFAASGLGAWLTTFAKDDNQAGIVGSAVSLLFGALGGSFFPASNLEGVLDIVSRLTVNRWAMDGLTKLTIGGGTFSDILTEAGVLAAIGLVTFSLSLIAFQKRFVK